MTADIDALKAATKIVLQDIIKHANGLATGLQNAAPPQEGGVSPSILYLTESATQMSQLIHVLDAVSSFSGENKRALVELAEEIMRGDNALRETHQIGEKFRFVRDRLQALLEQLEKQANATETEKKAVMSVAADEVLIYVYLYNSQGVLLSTWLNMLTPKLFYEYSVNRPLYQDKSHVDLLIRSKANKVQHAYLTVAVKQSMVIQSEDLSKDVLGNPMTKVKEGAFLFDRLMAFTHGEQDYTLNENRVFVKKI